jgi:F-type H+-transporting ATPase subunit delta
VTSSDGQTYARALYETLAGSVLEQLRSALPKVQQINTDADPAELRKQVNAALPKQALPEVKNFLALLVEQNALDQLPAIIDTLEQYAQGEPMVLEGEVTSAVELDEAQQKRIQNELAKQYKKELDLTFTVDESLIGGLVIRIGDQVLDNSLRARLGTVQRSMLAG